MKSRYLLCATLLPLLLTGCIEPIATGPACYRVVATPVGTAGDTTILASGLRYIDGAPGTGTPLTHCMLADVRYTLRLSDGVVRETNANDERPLPVFVGGGGVIAGFEQGLVGMRVNGSRRLIVPPALGYGATQNHPLRNETLIFDITVEAIR